MVDRGAVFIGDVEGAVGAHREALAIDGELAARGGDVAVALQRGGAGRIDGGGGLAGEVGHADGALQGEGELRLPDVIGRVVRREGEPHLLDARRIGDQAGDIVTAIRQRVERAGVATVGVLAPGGVIHLEGGERAEGIAATVDDVGGEDADADEALVHVRLSAEGNVAREGRSRRVQQRRTVIGRVERTDGGGEEEGTSEVTHRVWTPSRQTHRR